MYRYTRWHKLRFLLSYFWYKLQLPCEVKSPRLRFCLYEAMYTLCKFFEYQACLAYPFHDSRIQTRFGLFTFQRGTADAASISPAYERGDINYLLKLIRQSVTQQRRVLFLDVGADIGMFTVTVLNASPPQVAVAAFEPISRSFALIQENLQINGHTNSERVRLFPVAVGDVAGGKVHLHFDATVPGSSGLIRSPSSHQTVEIETQTLDALVLDWARDFDDVIIKIDVEGMEVNVLRGANQLLARGGKTYILVEDFLERKVIDYLAGQPNIRFLTKFTDYNSWWLAS